MENNMVTINPDTLKVQGINGKGIWNPKGLFVLSILFSFLPAAIIYALNCGRLGVKKKRDLTLIISFLTFAITMSLLFLNVIGQELARSLFVGLNAGAAGFMYKDQAQLYKQHVAGGGKKASYLIPSLCCVTATALIIGSIFYSINIPDKYLKYGKSDLYYTNHVGQSEAEKLGKYLDDNGFFKDKEVSVKIDKQSEVYQFYLIISKEYFTNEEFLQTIRPFSRELSTQVFNNSKVEIHFSDERFNSLKTITDDSNPVPAKS